MFDLRGRKPGLQRLVLLQQGARLFVVPDGVCDGKDLHRFISCLYAIAIGLLSLSGRQCMIGQLGGPRSLARKPRQGAPVQDLPPRRAEFGVDHLADQVMGEVIAAWPACPNFLLAQEATADGLLQSLDAGLRSLSPGQDAHLGHLPQVLGSRLDP